MLLKNVFGKLQTMCFPVPINSQSLYTASILEAARKGTRMKRDAKKKTLKKEVIKKQFIPYAKRMEMEKVGKISRRKVDDSERGLPVDDVYIRGMYRRQIFNVAEAMELHQETQHPTQFNNPKADLIAHIELSMSTIKKNTYVKAFKEVILFPHLYETNHNRTTLVICKDEEMIESIKQLGVTLALGPEVVKMADKGDLDFKQYNHILCHSQLLPNLISIRALLKNNFPSPRNGTAGVNLVPLVTRFLQGVEYEVVKDKYDLDFAEVKTKIGTLEMEPLHVEENLRALVANIESKKPPNRKLPLITMLTLNCSGSREYFKLDDALYVPDSPVNEEVEAAI